MKFVIIGNMIGSIFLPLALVLTIIGSVGQPDATRYTAYGMAAVFSVVYCRDEGKWVNPFGIWNKRNFNILRGRE